MSDELCLKSCSMCSQFTILDELRDTKSKMDQNIAHKYKTITDEYNRTNKPFEDEEFPASAKSIGDLPKLKNKCIKWLRPPAIDTRSKDEEWTVCRNISPSNISQGSVGNCWFLSSIAVVAASRPELIEKLILTQKFDRAGVYILRLCKDGVWKSVIVDDQFPCDENGRLIFAKAKDKQIWVCLLEKALAKLYGSYQALQSGLALEGLVSLSGYPAQSLYFQKREEENEHNPDIIWQTLLSCCKAGFLMGISCGRNEICEEEYEKIGLLNNHAYSVLQVRSVSNLRLLHLRNPWGKYSWKGDWNLGSQLWTPDLMEKLQAPKQDDGTFWISYTDILKYFDRADICQIRPTWQEHRFQGAFANGASKAVSYYQIVVSKPTELEYALYQPSERTQGYGGKNGAEIQTDMCMIFVSIEESSDGYLKIKRYLGSSPRKLSSCVIGKLRDNILPPGTYAIIPFSISSLCTRDKNNSYAVSIHSSVEIKAVSKEAPAELLTDCIMAFGIKSGEKKDYSVNLRLYTRWGWSGVLLIAENKHAEKYLRICCDLSQSKNVNSSRASRSGSKNGLETWDVIPPRCRQILAILTRSANHSTFKMFYQLRYLHVQEDTIENFAPGNDGRGKRHLPELESILHQPRTTVLED